MYYLINYRVEYILVRLLEMFLWSKEKCGVNQIIYGVTNNNQDSSLGSHMAVLSIDSSCRFHFNYTVFLGDMVKSLGFGYKDSIERSKIISSIQMTNEDYCHKQKID